MYTYIPVLHYEVFLYSFLAASCSNTRIHCTIQCRCRFFPWPYDNTFFKILLPYSCKESGGPLFKKCCCHVIRKPFLSQMDTKTFFINVYSPLKATCRFVHHITVPYISQMVRKYFSLSLDAYSFQKIGVSISYIVTSASG